MQKNAQQIACTPAPLNPNGFNFSATLPFGLHVAHVRKAMEMFIDFLGFLNHALCTQNYPRLEALLMPATFSGIVGEFMKTNIARVCPTLVENRYHNGFPDLIPAGRFPNDAVQRTSDGIEIKASRYNQGWQGHNPEDIWLMVLVFDSNRPSDAEAHPRPFRFKAVYCAKLTKNDWTYAGRQGQSRRTITASVNSTGLAKLTNNWVYKDNP